MIAPIQPTDRVRDVIARDARLVDVFVAHSPHFEKLRNPVMRRILAATVTVEQAAAMAGVAPAALAAVLNDALGIAVPTQAVAFERSAPPLASRHPAGRIVVELDVRDDLRNGREPFGRIMSAARTLDDDVLRVRASFEPLPLVSVLAQRGLVCETERHADDDWSLWAWRATPETVVDVAAAPRTVAETSASEPAEEMWLDVRGLEPPEPMVRTLEALATMPRGHTLVQINVRVPQYLLPRLAERGFVYDIREQGPDLVRLFIRHREP